MSHLQSQLTRFQPYSPWDDDQVRGKAKKLWHDTGTVMVRPEWVGNELDRQHMVNIGTKLFGRRDGA